MMSTDFLVAAARERHKRRPGRADVGAYAYSPRLQAHQIRMDSNETGNTSAA